MDDPDGLFAAAHDNYVESFRVLGRALPGGDVLELDGAEFVFSGRPDPEFNRLFAWAPLPEAPALLAKAALEARRRGCGFTIVAGPAANKCIRDATKAAGVPPGMPQSVMLLPRLDSVSAAQAIPGLVIEAVGSPAMAEAFVAVLEDGFATPPGFYRSYACPGAWDAPGVRHYIGWLNDEPVATSAVVVSGEMAGVYHVSTIREFRKMGLASALTRHALREAAAGGCQSATLQPTAMGYRLYAALGFRPAFSYATWYLAPP